MTLPLAAGCAKSGSQLAERESGRSEGPACSQGDTRECVGQAACAGGQFCEDGAWSQCDCGSAISSAVDGGLDTKATDVTPNLPASDVKPPTPTPPTPTLAGGPPDDLESSSVDAGGSASGGSSDPTEAGPASEAPSGSPDGGTAPRPLACPDVGYFGAICRYGEFECNVDDTCGDGECRDGLCSRPCEVHGDCGDYGLCEAGECRGIPFCGAQLYPPSYSWSSLPHNEPLYYLVNDFPVWCAGGKEATPGFAPDVGFEIDVGLDRHPIGSLLLFVAIQKGLAAPVLGIRGGTNFGNDLAARIDLEAGETETDAGVRTELVEAEGGWEVRVSMGTAAGDWFSQLELYVESEGLRAYLTKPNSDTDGDPCLKPYCSTVLTLEE